MHAGGLAAPVLAGAMAAVGSPFAGLGAAAVVGAFGAGGAHAAGTRMARRIGAHPLQSPVARVPSRHFAPGS